MKYHYLIFGLIFAGCTYGFDTEVTVTRISNKTYSENIYMPEVYFDDPNMKISREYEQLAFIEVKGNGYSSIEALLHEMKKKGSEIGSDAIINIKQHFIIRERGEIVLENIDKERNKAEEYHTISLTGLAIKYK